MPIDKKDVIAFFDKNAPFWDDDVTFKKEVIGKILDAGRIEAGKSVLDVACGTGILFDFYAERGVTRLTGMDISPEMVRIAREKHPGTAVICDDVETYPFPEKFDCIMIHNAFPHFPDPERLIRRMSEILAPGGQFTIAHSYSRDTINHRHSGKVVSKVSVGLMTETELAELFRPYFEVTTMVSDEEKYIVSGTLR